MSTRTTYLLGCGDHGTVVLDALLECELPVTGILDQRLAVQSRVLGVPVLGSDALLDKVSVTEVHLVNGVGANPRTAARKKLFERYKARGFAFLEVRHPSAMVSRASTLGEGCHVMSGAVIQTKVRLGDNCLINTGAIIDHESRLDAHVVVSPGATVCGSVTIGEAAFIGAGAVILPGIQIGRGAIVGAGAVVLEAVPEDTVVAGNPAVVRGMVEQRA